MNSILTKALELMERFLSGDGKTADEVQVKIEERFESSLLTPYKFNEN